MNRSTQRYDVVIIGGGPTGATAAAILAMNGRRVAVIEKEHFPRYHVGESLVPYCYFTLNRIGMVEKLRKTHFTKKYSVQFASTRGNISQPFYFGEHLDHAAAQTWQVRRSEFDKMLLDNAREKGADVFEGWRVREALENDGAITGIIAQDENDDRNEFIAPVTIDASGRNSFFVNRNGWRVMDDQLKKVSIWTYYKGAKRDAGIDEGATTVAYIPEKGWFWYIPLADDVVSVGVVAEKSYLYRETRDPQEIFLREIQNNRWIADHLAPGTQFGEFWVTGDYSYRSKYCAADGVVLAGDAFAFLDPVFSTGVLLALVGGELAADAVEIALQQNNFRASQFSEYSDVVRYNLEAMRKLVYAFYNDAFNFRSFFEKYPQLRSDVTDILIGKTDRSYDELFNAMREFAELPADLPHGKPLIAETV